MIRQWFLRGWRIAAVVLLLYFFILPLCWPAPEATLRLPATAQFDKNATVELTVSAWHSNVSIIQVYLVAEYPNYKALGLNASLYPIMLSQQPPAPGRVNRFTWPYHAHYTYTIPLEELASKGLSTPGVWHGQAHIQLSYPGSSYLMHRRRYGSPPAFSSRHISVPFTITLTDHENHKEGY